jgi:hypothetical protein
MRSPSALFLLCVSAALLLAQRAAAAAEQDGNFKAAPVPADNLFGGRNVLLFLSDQVRAGWRLRHAGMGSG